MRGPAVPRKDRDFESRLNVERIAEPELLDEVESRRAAGEDHMLSAVDLVALHLERGCLAAEQARALVQVDTPATLGELEPGGESGETRSDHCDARLSCHTAASHDRAITPSFAAFDRRARPRSGSSGAASMRSRIPR